MTNNFTVGDIICYKFKDSLDEVFQLLSINDKGVCTLKVLYLHPMYRGKSRYSKMEIGKTINCTYTWLTKGDFHLYTGNAAALEVLFG